MERTVVERNYRPAIAALSALVPVAVAVLMYMPFKGETGGSWLNMLPHLNAAINGVTFVLLIIGLIMIRRGKREVHKMVMTSAFILGAVFLVSYLTYHSSVPSTVFGDLDGNGALDEIEKAQAGASRTFYLGLLLSHILLAMAVVPLVVLALFYGLSRSFDCHKKIVRYAYPVWLYVTLSGVAVYLMIRPFY